MKQIKYYEVKKAWINKKQIQQIKDKLKKDGWIPLGCFPESEWETYQPSVIAYDYNSGENIYMTYRNFVKDKYNENPSKRRKITARKFVFDRLTK